MEWFKCIQYCYSWKAYNDEDVAKYVELGKITDIQYKQITGKDYPTPNNVPSGETDEPAGEELNKEG
ncbi:XkdX family protein [Bacillus spizizenii]|uniref:XkdX family protein n=1 Tax=Bacillus spizizenii TaxID=96241 RepID=UPI002DB892EC|nr:XkdX family protein [Bacillus spizizenii]MEC2181997.1 XkdX family protein [Bacillus spizizenii]